MRAKLADPRVIGPHLGSMVIRHRHKLTAGKNVEFIRMENEAAGDKVGRRQSFPIVAHRATCRGIDIDQAGMLAGTPADDAVFICRRQIDAERHTIANIDGAGTAHKADILLQPDHRGIRHG